MSGDLGRFLRSEWLTIRTQMALGIVFLVAAWPKLLQPPVFAKNVWAYDMLPDVLVTAMALLSRTRSDYAPAVGAACGPRNVPVGVDRVYSLTLSAGQRLSVTFP